MRFALYILMWVALVPSAFASTAGGSNDSTNSGDSTACIGLLSTNPASLQIQVSQKITDRTAHALDVTPTLVRDDGKEPTDLIGGIKQLFSRDIMNADIEATRLHLVQLADAWVASQRKIMTKSVEAKLRGEAIEDMRQNILSIKALYNTEISEQGRSLTEKITLEYSSGKRSEPNFQELQDYLFALKNRMLNDFQEKYPLAQDEKSKGLIALLNKTDIFPHPVILNEHGLMQIEIRPSQAIGVYEPSIGTFALRLNDKTTQTLLSEIAFTAILAHGCGTEKSNVASWTVLFPLIAQNGILPFAFNMPGAVGECGIAMNSLRTWEEVGTYINHHLSHYVHNSVPAEADLPLIYFGRSAGSTQGSFAALINEIITAHLTQLEATPLFTQAPELYYLTSHSDPNTQEHQDASLEAQIRRGDVKGKRPEALEHFKVATTGFQAHVEKLKATHPHVSDNISDDIVLAQGESDQDGQIPGSNKTAVEHTLKYRDENAPFAHVYSFEDPLLDYAKKGLLEKIPYDAREATHFLLSNVDNVSEKNRGELPVEIPEIDLPKKRDQSLENFALIMAMMDYKIDLSPIASAAKKSELREKRFKLTGSYAPYAYLNWYIINKLDRKIPGIENLTLQKIIDDSNINANRSSGIPGRVKKVFNFIHSEADRINKILDERQKHANKNPKRPAA